jgi:hypothetical protein
MNGRWGFGGTAPNSNWLFQAFLKESTEEAPTFGRGPSLNVKDYEIITHHRVDSLHKKFPVFFSSVFNSGIGKIG